MMRTTLLACASVAVLAANASSQELNYADYEMLFGEPVTVGATGTPQRASDVPVNMTIITAEEIRHSGARDVIEVLRRHAGLDVQRTGQTSAAISVRGMNIDSGRVRVLINGRDTFRNYEGVTLWAALPVNMEEIRQIEIVRGPSTALYGANAVTGVINIITYNPLFEDSSNATVRVGFEGHREFTGHTTFQLPDNRGGIRLSYGQGEFDRFDAGLNSLQRSTRGEPEYERVSLDSLFQLADSLQAGFEYTQFEGDSRMLNATGDQSDAVADDDSIKAFITGETSLGVWRFQGHQNNQSETRISVIDTGSGPFSFDQTVEAESTAFSLSNVSKPTASIGLRLSAGFQEDSVAQFGGSIADNTGDVSYTTWYAAGLVDWSISSTLNLATSLRLDQLESERTAIDLPLAPFVNDDFDGFTVVSANIGLNWTASNGDRFRFTYARGFNAPNLFRIGGQLIDASATFPGFGGIGGNPLDEPEISQQYEASWQRNLADINGAVSASLFYRTDDDIVRSAVSGFIFPSPSGLLYMGAGQVGSAETLGFEIELGGETAAGFDWDLRYSYADTESDVASQLPAGSIGFTANILPIFTLDYFDGRSSEHIFTATGTWTSDRYWVDGLVQYKSGYDSYAGAIALPGQTTATSIDAVTVLNLTVGYEITDNLAFVVAGEGLLDDQRQEVISVLSTADRRVWGALTWDF